MSRVFLSLCGLMCLGLAGAVGYFALIPIKPRQAPPIALEVEPAIHEFGVAGQMETLRAEFRLVNRFPTAVDFTDLLRTCSCAHATVAPERLEPGQSATLTVEWQTGNRRGKASEVVTVYAVGEEGPIAVQVQLTAEIEPDVRFEPSEARFTRGETTTTVVQFSSGRMVDARINSAHTNASVLQATVDPVSNALSIQYDPAKSKGDPIPTDAAVIVKTTSPKEPWVRVPVTFTGTR